MALNLDSRFKLNNGIKIPVLGLGTWDLYGDDAYNAVQWALEAGYRLIDTAKIYANERPIGKALEDAKINREELFITSKVWETDFGYNSTLKAFEKSLNKLKLKYMDLYLIHWPQNKRIETWKALEKLYEDGNVLAIGVSNFTIKHLKELFNETSIIPAINQVEFSPFLYQKELLEFCTSNEIRLEAYSPLTRAKKLDNPVLREIGKKYQKSTAQVLLRWGLEHGIIEIPKSGNKHHIIENADVFDFELTKEEMSQINDLNENLRVTYDPATIQ